MIVLVSSDNLGASIVQNEDGSWSWFVCVQTGNGIDYLPPTGQNRFTTRERALVSMNHFLKTHGFRESEPATSPVFAGPSNFSAGVIN